MDRDSWPLIVVVVIALGLAVLGGKCCVGGCGSGYSDGERTGQITKFSRKGLMIKSWEGELNLGGFKTKSTENGGSAIVANTWEFTVLSDGLVNKIQQALQAGKPVKISYREWLWSPISMDSAYEALGVEVLQ